MTEIDAGAQQLVKNRPDRAMSPGLLRSPFEEKHDIRIGAEAQLAAAVTAERDDGEAACFFPRRPRLTGHEVIHAPRQGLRHAEAAGTAPMERFDLREPVAHKRIAI